MKHVVAVLNACETWSPKITNVHSGNVLLNNYFRHVVNCFWQYSRKLLLFYCIMLTIIAFCSV